MMTSSNQKAYRAILDTLLARYPELKCVQEDILTAYDLLCDCFRGGNKVLICGNGGSAADAGHIVGELMKSFTLRRKMDPAIYRRLEALVPETAEGFGRYIEGALPAVDLTGSGAFSTAFQNDVSGEYVFAQQVYGLAKEHDTLWCLSTSGNSTNVILAAQMAKAKDVTVIGMTGGGGGELLRWCDVCIRVPAEETYRVQEFHLPVYHALCAMLEAVFFGGENSQ